MYYPRLFVRPFDRVDNPLDLSVKQAIARPEGACAADQLLIDSKFATSRPLAPQLPLLDSMYAQYKPFGTDSTPCSMGGTGRLLAPSLSNYCPTDHMNLMPELLPQNRTLLGLEATGPTLTHFPIDPSGLPYHMRIATNQRAFFGPNLQHMAGPFGASIPHISLYADLLGDMPSHRHAIDAEKSVFCAMPDMRAPVEPTSRFSDHLQRLRDLQQSKWSTPCCLPNNTCNCCNVMPNNVSALIVPSAATHRRQLLTNAIDISDNNNNSHQHSADTKCVSSAPKLWNPSHIDDTKSPLATNSSRVSAPDVITLDEENSENDKNCIKIIESKRTQDMNSVVIERQMTSESTADTDSVMKWTECEDRPEVVSVSETQRTSATESAVKCSGNTVVVKQLKDYKLVPKNAINSSVDVKRNPKQTKTVEVQCNGPDWTPIVLPTQLKTKLRNKMSLTTESLKKEKCRQKHFHRSHSRSRSSSTERMRQLAEEVKSRKRSMLQCLVNSDGYVADKMRRCDVQHNLFADPSHLGREERALQRALKDFEELRDSTEAYITRESAQTFANSNENKNINTINTIGTGIQNECTEDINYEEIIESVVSESRDRYVSDRIESKDSLSPLSADIECKRNERKSGEEMQTNCLDDSVNGMEGKGVKCSEKTAMKANKQRKTITSVRRRRFRSGMDMIRRKKTRINHVKDTRNREESKSSEDMHSANGSVPTETRRLMVNKALGETLLHRAARSNRKDVVQSCLASNTCDVNARDNANYTPLHECAIRGHLCIARMLLQHGADVEASAAGGIRPIHDAIENNHLEVVRLLLSYGADPNITTYSGATPVQLVRSKAMLNFLTGFLCDISGDEAKDVLVWKFNGSANTFDMNQMGFNVFDGLPSDRDDESHDFLFEVSDTPLAPTYRLHNKGFAHFMRLTDVLRRSGLKRDQFVKKHFNVQIVSISRQEFERATTCQLMPHQGGGGGVKGDGNVQGHVNECEEMVVFDDKVKSLLGIETLRLI